jgi:sugar phosphate permease
LIDRIGARLVMAAGVTVVGVGSILLSQVKSLPLFYAIYATSGVGQGAATLIPVSLVITNWFSAKRGKALGIVMTGTGLGLMVMVPVTTWIVITWDWRTSYLVMGCIMLLVVPLILVFVRTRPSDMGLLPDGEEPREEAPGSVEGLTVSQALRTRAFWLIGFMMLVGGLVGLGVNVHLMAYLTDLGHAQTRASLVPSIVGGMTVFGKLGMGLIADRWGVRRAVVFTFSTLVAGLFFLMGAEAFPIACIFAVVYGFAIGAPLVINPALTAECMGLKHFGVLFGILTLLTTTGAAAGAVLSGVIYDSVKSYLPAFVLYVILSVAAGVCGAMARGQQAPRPQA